MKKITVIIAVIIGIIVLGYTLTNDPKNVENGDVETESLARYENTDPDFSFMYDASEDGYEILSPKTDNSITGGLEKSLVIINKKEHAEALSSVDTREGPPTINIIYFKNPGALTPREWVEQDAGFTDFNQRRLTKISETDIDRIPAIEFIADGLYASRVVVSSYQDRVFMLIGSFISEDDKISGDFREILESFRFGI